MSFDIPGGVAVAILLVVEDDEQVRVLVESFLETGGHKTLSAGSVEQALALLENEEHHIDLLLTDLRMQDDSEAGLKLAKTAVELRPDLRVLYTSGQGVTDGMIALFVEKSAYLPKPYTGDQLANILRMKFGL
jgi:DNA-binding NtrC family response regulator